MDKKYFDSTHRFGRIGALIGIVFMLGIPAVISQVYGVWPESVGSVFMTGSALLAVFIPSNISEVLSFSPVLGSASYIAFLTGNVTNLKLPCAMNAMTQADVSQGTDEGDVIASIAIAASSIITTIIIIVGVILLVPLQPLLTMPAVKTATAYMLPALFGSLFLGMFNENCGNFVAKGKLKCAVLPFILVLVVNHFYSLSGKEGFVVLAVMALSVLCAYVLYKNGGIKLIPKKAPAEEEPAEKAAH